MSEPASSSPHDGPNWLRPVLVALLAVLIAGYVTLLVRYGSPYAGGSDSSGYFNSARLFSQGEFFALPRMLPGHSAREFGDLSVQPLGFTLRPDGRLAPTYPTGYPLHLAAAALGGWAHASIVVNVVTALASGLLLFAFCRKLDLPPGLALGGVGLMWLCPLFLFQAIQPMSDLPALCWSLTTLYCAVSARDNWKWGVLCGAAMGMAVLVRLTNVLLVVPLLVALGLRPRSWLAVGLGSLPGMAFLCYYNWRVYGSPVTTGYGAVSSAFSHEFLPHNLAHFARWIPTFLSPLVVLALVSPFLPGIRQRGYAVLTAWFATLTGFYAFYSYSGEAWWYLRFILPVFPALLVVTLAVLDNAWRAARRRPLTATIVLGVLLLSAAAWELNQTHRLEVLLFEEDERTYPEATRWAQNNLPAGSVILCMQVGGAFFYYTDFTLYRWDQVAAGKYDALFAAAAQNGRPVYAALYPFESPAALERIGGHWTELATVNQVTFWQRQP